MPSKCIFSPEIQKNVVEKDLWVKAGDHIARFEAANHAIGTLVLCFDNKEEMMQVTHHVNQYVEVQQYLIFFLCI